MTIDLKTSFIKYWGRLKLLLSVIFGPEKVIYKNALGDCIILIHNFPTNIMPSSKIFNLVEIASKIYIFKSLGSKSQTSRKVIQISICVVDNWDLGVKKIENQRNHASYVKDKIVLFIFSL